MDEDVRKISLVIREEQYRKLSEAGVNVSGLIRDLIDDHFSRHAIIINVSEETRTLYDQIVSQAPGGDVEIEPYFRAALGELLKTKMKEMEKIHQKLVKK